MKTANELPELEKPVKSIHYKQILAMFVVAIGYIHMGSIISFPTLLLVEGNSTLSNVYGQEIVLSPRQIDLFGSLMAVGTLLSCCVLSFITSRYGKKKTLYLSGLIGFFSWAGMALSPTVAVLLTFRITCGVSMGIVSVAGSNYITEIVEPRVRGSFISILDFFIVFGQFWTVALGYSLQYYNVSFVNSTLSMIFITGMFFLPESPAFLVVQGKMKEAKEILREIRTEGTDIDGEIMIYYEQNVLEVKDKNVWKGLRSPKIAKRIAIVLVLYFIRCFCGYEVITANPTRMFVPYDVVSAKIAGLVLSVFQMFSVIIFSLLIIDIHGRRKSMFLSLGISIFGFMILSGYHLYDQYGIGNPNGLAPHFLNTEEKYELVEYEPSSHQSSLYNYTNIRTSEEFIDQFSYKSINGNASNQDSRAIYGVENTIIENIIMYLPVCGLMICIIGLNFGVATVPFVVTSEYFPTWLRAQAGSLCVGGFTLFQFAALVSYTSMLDTLTYAGFYLFSLSICVLALPFTVHFIIETMGEHVA